MASEGAVLLDMAFSFDTTGSMSTVIDEVRDNIAEMLQRLSNGIPGIRVAVIAHGDYGDDYETEIRDFDTPLKRLVNFVKTVSITGGSDEPECYELVLQQARTHLSWRPGSTRALVLVGDSFPHEVGSARNKYKIDWKAEVQQLKQLEVTVYCVQCKGENPQTEAFMKHVAQETGGLQLPLEEFRGVRDYLVGISYREGGLLRDERDTAGRKALILADGQKRDRTVLTGVLMDVSGSMQRSFDSQRAAEAAGYARRNQWIRSIFQVADRLVAHDVSPSHLVFVGGVGAQEEPVVFDILGSLENAKEELKRMKEFEERIRKIRGMKEEFEIRIEKIKRLYYYLFSVIEEAVSILERNGAPRIRRWTTTGKLATHIDEHSACLILDGLQNDEEFMRKVVYDFLPEECRTYVVTSEVSSMKVCKFIPLVNIGHMVVEAKTASRVGDVVRQIKNYLNGKFEVEKRRIEAEAKRLEDEAKKMKLVPLTMTSVFCSTSARQILRDCNDGKELSDERISGIMQTIEPMIFGDTPMMKALQKSLNIFGKIQYEKFFKLFFILSDGMPTESIRGWTSVLGSDVIVVSCFITDSHIAQPRRLYSSACNDWDKSAQFMFQISSSISTQLIPRTLFIKRDWKIDTESNETRLFFQINHPNMIDEVCDIAKSCVCSQDALSDVLSEVDLDLYINKANEGFGPQQQSKLTCYAVASATVMHLSMMRIVGREDGYPDFFEIRDKIVAKYGEKRAKTVKVLREVCPEYRLQCKEVDDSSALEAVIAKRPVVVTFQLMKCEWVKFKEFFKKKPKSILKKADLQEQPLSKEDSKLFGHAVVLVSFDRHGLRLINSWGSHWGDGGFFRVQSADVLREMKFIDVEWTELTTAERRAFKEHGPAVAEKLFSSLKGLQTCKYKCPLCSVESLVSEFSGHTLEARCPRCSGAFNANVAGSDLALNLYLTSLLHTEVK